MPANLRPYKFLESTSSAPVGAKLWLSKKASCLWTALGTVSLYAALAIVGSAHAELMGADERLEAIRNSLVQAALDGPTEVKSTMWVDKDGALHESNTFTSGMEVRGVRVLSYGRDANAGSSGEGSSNAQLSTEGRKNLKTSACGKTTFADKLAVWHHMTLDIVLASNMNANQKYRANQVMQDLRRNLLLTSAQSRLVHLADMTIPVSRYEQVLVGKGEEYIPWRVRLTLGVSADSLPTAPTFVAHFDVNERSLPEVFLSYEQLISLDSHPENTTPRPLSPVVMQEVEAVSKGFIKTLETKLSCAPPQFQVLKIQSDTFRINGGSMSGLHVGDRLVVADKSKIPNHVLEPAALASMAMTQVTAVSGYYADLKQIAGPALGASVNTGSGAGANSQWVAIVQSH
jgi:hypothetical protein